MGKSAGKGASKADKIEKAEPQAATPVDGELPVVQSPKLDAGEAVVPEDQPVDEAPAETASESTSETVAETAPAAPQAQSSRFALLAAAIALFAALGSFIGSLTASGVLRLTPTDAAVARNADVTNVSQTMRAELAELSAIKSNLDNATRSTNSQFAKIADRLDRVEHAAPDPSAKLSHISETVDRLETKQAAAAPDTTGSIKPADKATEPPPGDQKVTDRIVDGWTVEEVHYGRALVQGRHHGYFDVGSGSFLPGLGRVQTVKRQDGQWTVITDSGTITSGR